MKLPFLVGIFGFVGVPLWASLQLAPLFQEGAVLQRDRPVPVWGRAAPGDTITVSFAGQEKSAEVDDLGRWQVTLSPLSSSTTGRVLTVASKSDAKSVVVQDVLVGEVWLASGQSNMEFRLRDTRPEDQAKVPAEVPLMRLFEVPHVTSHYRQDTVKAHWTEASRENSMNFSAVAWFFGKDLVDTLQVPVGLIHSSWGGSRIEPWWAVEGLKGIPELEEIRKHHLASTPGMLPYESLLRQYLDQEQAWIHEAKKALEANQAPPEEPARLKLLDLGPGGEAGMYEAMIHPLVPYALRGFLWYQGESNHGEGMLYTAKMRALIQGWRQVFQNPDAPFYEVQIAPFNYGEGHDQLVPQFWWAQQQVLQIPHTGMAITSDIGNLKDIHPNNKSDVGHRLARWALADAYQQEGLVKSGPLYAGYERQNGGILIHFDFIGSGLSTRDGKAPDWFEVAGEDDVYRPAQAQISADGKSVFLTSPDVADPDRARFAWSQLAEPNLGNKEGLPAGAFCTHWPQDPTLGKLVSANTPHQSSHPNTWGWDRGLTDGKWGNQAGTCYATDPSDQFPKTVTIDLGREQDLHAIVYGTPDIGATKTVAVSLSTDGKNFTEVGRHEFPPKTAEKRTVRFGPTPARYVRATFLDHHGQQDGYDAKFGFLSELEAYAP